MTDPSETVDLFLAGARAVRSAVAEPAVAEAWDQPSVLEHQTVGSLVSHLARGGVWAVGEYLDAGVPPGPLDFESAGEYFASFARTATADDHRAIRDRGAVLAALGHDRIIARLDEQLSALEERLAHLDPDQPVAVISALRIRLRDYLVTRIVEQAVHLDDLARSLHREPFTYPAEATDVALAVAVDVARLRMGRARVLRALFRRGEVEGVLPVL